MTVQTFVANGDMVILSRADYERLVERAEALDDLRVFDESEAADEEAFPAEFAKALLETDCPLRVWRKYRGLTQAQLAKVAHVRQGTISGIEKGASPKLATARTLAEALRCDIDDLF